MAEFINRLKTILEEGQILENEPMSRHTTFRVGGPARLFISPRMDQIAEVVKLCREFDIQVLVIGNGSNMLVGDFGIDGVVLEIGKAMSAVKVDGTKVIAQAGASLASVARAAANNSLTGLEFASGIPGALGGAIVMNAGAYGGEMSQVVKEAKVLTPEGEILTLSLEELDLSYRHSIIPEKHYIVLEVTMELTIGNEEEIKETMKTLNGQRREKQPLEYPSAGSTFKRPTGYFAGKLVQDAGLAGYRVGGAMVSDKHCGFVINYDNATAADVVSLMEDVSRIVNEKFGVTLEPEVKMVGNFKIDKE